jgi:aspartyl-tRNA(Asn)/glutamyl-tRNA(Gln) amidotransferase subunit C
MALTREDVAALAHLARIALNEEELARAEKELDNVLGYVDRLQKIDTSGVEEAAPEAVTATAFREDVAIPCDDEGRRLIIQNFPAKQSDYLKAPAVFERPKK